MGDWEQILRELTEIDMRHGGFIQSALDEIESLRQQLASAQEELHFQACLTRDLLPYQERAIKSEQQLAAALAACEAKDAVLNGIKLYRTFNGDDWPSREAITALVTKPDASALKVHDEALIERCAAVCEEYQGSAETCAAAIRELKGKL